ncbi:MAG: glycosyltransferase family 2 protein [Flavobacteriales bacterium]|nr:glycosyltransferase family 2 protein [Flavobacteriales bacterium]
MPASQTTFRAAIAVLNWNGIDHLRSFLPSVVEHCNAEDCVVLIDNGSTDDSLDFVRSQYPEVKIVCNSENFGFAGGYNRGLAQLFEKIQAQWTVLLNSDVEVTAGWLDAVIGAMKAHGWSAAAPTIRSYDRRDHFEYAGAAGGYIDRNGFVFCAGRLFDTYESDAGQYGQDRQVFWASGAALVVETAAWLEVQGLDEGFFAHMEEIDLCWRLQNRGYKIGSTASAHVFHLGGGTLNKLSSRKTYLNFRNNLFLLLKNERSPILPRLFFRMILDGVAATKFLTEAKLSFFFSVWRAHIAFFIHLPAMISKRRRERRAWRAAGEPVPVGRFAGSIVWAHFARKTQHFSELPADRFS